MRRLVVLSATLIGSDSCSGAAEAVPDGDEGDVFDPPAEVPELQPAAMQAAKTTADTA
jgi:hypothetical protein